MSRQLKFHALPELIQRIVALPRSANCELRIEVNSRYGKRYVSAEVWLRKRGGEWWRRNAVHFTPDELGPVLVALRKARTMLRVAPGRVSAADPGRGD